MPPALQFLVLTFAGWVNRHQDDLIDYLREENRVLREHLGPRPLRPAFRAALMLGGRPPPLEALRGLAADRPTVGLPPPAGPTDVEHRPAPRAAAAHRAPQPGSGAHAGVTLAGGSVSRTAGREERVARRRGAGLMPHNKRMGIRAGRLLGRRSSDDLGE